MLILLRLANQGHFFGKGPSVIVFPFKTLVYERNVLQMQSIQLVAKNVKQRKDIRVEDFTGHWEIPCILVGHAAPACNNRGFNQ